jgi:hypothetical protein
MTTIGGIPAVVLTSAVALLLSGEGPIQHARPVSLAAILVGLPLLAGLVFGLSGRRAPRPTTV